MKILCLLLLATATAFAQSSSRFSITRSVIAGGGATGTTNSRFQLGGTVAQPLAAVPAGPRFSIQGGFWIWPAPILFAPAKVGTDFVFSFQTERGKNYAVQYVDSRCNPNWQSLPGIAGDGTVKTVTNTTSTVSQGFFRIGEFK